LLIRKKVQIQFITKGSKISDIRSALNRCCTEYLMVWNRRYVRTHSNYRVNIGSSILDLSSLIGVGVIAGPSLRSKVQHAWIKSGSSAGAGFKKNLRKFCSQTGI